MSFVFRIHEKYKIIERNERDKTITFKIPRHRPEEPIYIDRFFNITFPKVEFDTITFTKKSLSSVDRSFITYPKVEFDTITFTKKSLSSVDRSFITYHI